MKIRSPEIDVCQKDASMDPRVTVIIPTYNRAHFLPECLDSLLAQTVPAAEVIVVNDGSTDDTLEALAPYRDRVVYLEKPNGGKASALNVGLAHASGEFIWICDDDDISLPDALETQLNAIAKSPHADFTYSGYHLGIPDTKTGKLQIVKSFLPFKGFSQSLFLSFAMGATGPGIGFMSQQGMLVRKRCFDVLGPFDETLTGSEDLEMNLRLCRAFQGVRVDRQTFIVRRHTGNRGPSHAIYSYSERDKNLGETDRAVFRKLYETTPLNAFLEDPTLQECNRNWRAVALVSRSQVMACRNLAAQSRADLADLRDQVLCGNIALDEPILEGAFYIERIFRERSQADEARFVLTMVRELLSSTASSPRMRGYVTRYFFWKGLQGLRSGKIAAAMSGLGKFTFIFFKWPGIAPKLLPPKKPGVL
jgi:glycosyltransferase involved in cell wall biosynthesis